MMGCVTACARTKRIVATSPPKTASFHKELFGGVMNAYKVDRSLLEAHSSAEIRRILREERDDYTPEALKIFEEVLASRGETLTSHGAAVVNVASGSAGLSQLNLEDRLIGSPTDARRVLDGVLKGVLAGSVDPQMGQAVSSIVMTMLRAMELEYVSDAEEEA
jgi:hypothetical protein